MSVRGAGYFLFITAAYFHFSPNIGTIPNVIVGPSHFATEHPTVRHAGSTENYQGFGRPKTASIRVISPGVNTSLFDPALYRGEGALSIQQYHDKVYAREAEIVNVTSSSRSRPPFVIGFVGRLSVEKNVGLFLLAAQRILETCLHCRFTVVGAGALREKLELLCAQLDIAWAVHFAGNITITSCIVLIFLLIFTFVSPSLYPHDRQVGSMRPPCPPFWQAWTWSSTRLSVPGQKHFAL